MHVLDLLHAFLGLDDHFEHGFLLFQLIFRHDVIHHRLDIFKFTQRLALVGYGIGRLVVFKLLGRQHHVVADLLFLAGIGEDQKQAGVVFVINQDRRRLLAAGRDEVRQVQGQLVLTVDQRFTDGGRLLDVGLGLFDDAVLRRDEAGQHAGQGRNTALHFGLGGADVGKGQLPQNLLLHAQRARHVTRAGGL